MNYMKLLTFTAFAMLVLSGCSSKSPTTADFMRMHATDEKEVGIDQKAIAKEWDRGSKLKLSGEEMIKDGEKMVKNGDQGMTLGKQKIEQGNKNSAEGATIMSESERIFHEKYPDLKLDLTN